MPKGNVAKNIFFGLFALQHRGQESAGIAVSDGDNIRIHSKMGLISQVFREEDLNSLTGHVGIGHTRYSTMGGSKITNAQPIIVNGARGKLAVGHNGNVINADVLRDQIKKEWEVNFERTFDTEVIAELYANTPGNNCSQGASLKNNHPKIKEDGIPKYSKDAILLAEINL